MQNTISVVMLASVREIWEIWKANAIVILGVSSLVTVVQIWIVQVRIV